MSVIAELTVPAEDFLLHETLSAIPKAIVAIERVAAAPLNRLLQAFSVRVDDDDTFDHALRSDSSVRAASRLYDHEWGTLYAVEWTEAVKSTVRTVLETDATLLAARSREDVWDLRIRFREDNALSVFRDHCNAAGLGFDLNRLYRPGNSSASGRYGLTPAQHRALTTALERGYYEVPRQVTMTELAADLGVSQQALSERLRRAQATLVRGVLTGSSPGTTYRL